MHLLLVVLGALGVIGAFFFEMLAEGVFQVAGWATGWVVVPMLTLGRVVVEPRKRGVGAKPKWLGIDRAADGTLIVGAELGRRSASSSGSSWPASSS